MCVLWMISETSVTTSTKYHDVIQAPAFAGSVILTNKVTYTCIRDIGSPLFANKISFKI